MAFPIVPVLGAVSSAISALSGSKKKESKELLGKDDFLKLLVAQLKNQSPLNPMDNDQFVAQSAQFSSLEQLQNMNKSLDTMAGNTSGNSLASSTALVGRSITATAASFTYAGATATLPFTLDQAVPNAVLEVSDVNGAVVSRVSLGARAAGAQSTTFQPALNGQILPAGQYRYRIMSIDAAGRSTPLAAIAGTVGGVSLDQGTPTLTLGSRKVLLSDVAAVGAAGI